MLLDTISQSMLGSIRALAFELIQKAPDVSRFVSIVDEDDGEHCKIQIGILMDHQAKMDFIGSSLKRALEKIEAESEAPAPIAH